MQGELVGDFSESDTDMIFMSLFWNFSKSLNLFSLCIIFPCTLNYKESTGVRLMSVASMCLDRFFMNIY